MIRQAIILAGGLGTRLRPVVSGVPKCLAEVNGRPFLDYLIRYYLNQGILDFIFSVGYLHEQIETFVRESYPSISCSISLEYEPLGTGGAIKAACKLATSPVVLVCNGDTFFQVHLPQLDRFHHDKKANCTLCLKPMADFDRYGVVELDGNQAVKAFTEKKFYTSGLINGGVYAIDLEAFIKEPLPEKFSFEKDYLEKKVLLQPGETGLFGFVEDAYFIDIGIPGDYEKAQREFPHLKLN